MLARAAVAARRAAARVRAVPAARLSTARRVCDNSMQDEYGAMSPDVEVHTVPQLELESGAVLEQVDTR